MKRKEKKEKQKFVDDGRVIASMDSEYINGYASKQQRENRQALREARLTRKERWAIYKAALAHILPVFFMFLCSVFFVIIFLYFVWMR